MDVILLERVEKLGQMGDVVKVKPGYARNFLLPQRKALRATKQNIEHFEGRRTQLEAANLDRRKEAESVAAKVEGITCVLLRQASESAQLYGSVSAPDIAKAVGETGVSIVRNQVLLERPIKTLGIHAVRVMLHPEVIVSVNVNVARSVEEAEAQAAAHAAGEPMAAEDVAAAVFQGSDVEGVPPTEEIEAEGEAHTATPGEEAASASKTAD